MKLTNTKPNFHDLTDVEQLQVFETYLFKRVKDLTEAVVTPRTKGKKKKAGKAITLSSEQYELLQRLGLI